MRTLFEFLLGACWKVYSTVFKDNVNESEGPDQTAQMRSLIGPALSAYAPNFFSQYVASFCFIDIVFL